MFNYSTVESPSTQYKEKRLTYKYIFHEGGLGGGKWRNETGDFEITGDMNTSDKILLAIVAAIAAYLGSLFINSDSLDINDDTNGNADKVTLSAPNM